MKLTQTITAAAEQYRLAREKYFGLDEDLDHAEFDAVRRAYVDAATAVAHLVLLEVDNTAQALAGA